MKTIIAMADMRYGDKSFKKGDLFDVDELNCSRYKWITLIKCNKIGWGEPNVSVAYVPPKKKTPTKKTPSRKAE